ncbi:hypothetical protein F4782DRAFT_530881 [Xylaria castorea]|nr:hypothetical protein F4782DRAFT_530881 [Xylaria castorea]
MQPFLPLTLMKTSQYTDFYGWLSFKRKSRQQEISQVQEGTERPNIGLLQIHPPPSHHHLEEEQQASLDVVFVHGLNGNLYDTWTAPSGTYWPADLLPGVIPNCRIFSYGYNANLWFDAAHGNIYIYAENLVVELASERDEFSQSRPIIFIAHSLGGLVVKRALAFAQTRRQYGSLLESTKAVVFMGTPHQGSPLAGYGEFVSKLWNAVQGSASTSSTSQLKTFSRELQTIASDFTELASGMEIVTFYELKNMPYVGRIVEDWSARMNHPRETCLGISTNHMDICKFNSSSDQNFQSIVRQLQRLARQMLPSPSTPMERQSLPFTNLPAFLPSNFFYRDEIKHIHETLDTVPDDTFNIHCLYGIGGVGKTQLALQYAHIALKRHRVVFWIHADQEINLLDDIDEITRHLFPQYNSTESRPKPSSLFKQWLAQNSSWLIVFDNVDSIQTVKPYWPSSKYGAVLMTSRDPGIVSSQLGNRVVKTKVEPLSACQGTAFIQSQINDADIDQGAASELSKLLGGLPIALCHAVGYLNNTESTLQDLLDLPGIRNMSFQLLDEHKADAANFSYELRFATIFKPSLDSLATCSEAAQLLHFLALLNQDSIEEGLIKHQPYQSDRPFCWQTPGKYNQAIVELKSRSLIDRDAKKSILTFHRLVRWAVIRSWSPHDWQANFHITLDFLASRFPKQIKGRSMTKGTSLDNCRKVAAHVQALEIAYRQGKAHLSNLMEFAALLANCGYYMYERGLNSDAVTILRTAREICQKERGVAPDLTHALVLNNLAVIHGIRNEPRQALELDVQVVEWREALLGPEDIELANSFNNLGTKYYDMDDLVNSTKNWEKALKIYETAKDADEEILGTICANVGKHRAVTGDFAAADRLLTRGLEIHQRVLGRHYLTASSMFKLANLRVLQNDMVDAERLINESIQIRKELLGMEDSRVGVAYHKKASVLRKLGRHDEALSAIASAINAFEKSEGNCEPGLLARALFLKSFILEDISLLHSSPSKNAEAVHIRESALQRVNEQIGRTWSMTCLTEGEIDGLVQPDYR